MALQQRASLALANGASSLLRALREYGEHPSAAASWQEALVELLQGSLQRLLVALVQLFLTVCGIDLQVCTAPAPALADTLLHWEQVNRRDTNIAEANLQSV